MSKTPALPRKGALIAIGIYTPFLVFSFLDHRDAGFSLLTLIILAHIVLSKIPRLAIFIFFSLFISYSHQIIFYDPFDLRLPANMHREIKITGNLLDGLTKNSVKKISTNGDGFRSQITQDHYSLAFLGGSTTEEIYLDDMETWTANFSKAYANEINHKNQYKGFVNAGLSGTRLVHQLATAKRVSADFYIFFIGVNDWNYDVTNQILKKQPQDRITWLKGKLSFKKNIISKSYSHLKQSDSKNTSPVEVNGLTDHFERKLGTVLKRSQYVPQMDYLPSQYFKQRLVDILDFCSKKRCLIVNQPNIYRHAINDVTLQKKLWMTPPETSMTLATRDALRVAKEYNRFIASAAKQHHIAACDLDEEISSDPRNFLDDVHLTELGSQRLSKAVFTCFKKFLS